VRTVIETAALVRNGEMKATETLDETLAAIDRHNPELNSFVHIDVDLARAAAERVDALVADGVDPGPLAGVPFGVKDLDDCEGMPTSQGSLWFKGGPPAAADAIHVARFRAAGAVPVGKTAVPEFGTWAYTATKAWGVTRNPWDPSRTPGGSSGGSASAVAAGMVPFATASDGGGSTRTPAGFCGLVGHKPSFGRIPHPWSGSVAQLGVLGALATTVADAALLLDLASGPDRRDRRSLPAPTVEYAEAIETLDVRGLRVAWSVDLGFALVDPEVAAITRAAAEMLVSAGGLRFVEAEVSFPDSLDIYSKLGAVDTWIELPDGLWPDRADELDPQLLAGFEKGDRLTVRKFATTFTRRNALERKLAALFDDIDVLVTPTAAIPAFPAEGPMPREIAGQRVHPAMAVPFAMLGNMWGGPAISVPAGMTSDGLPVGLHVIGDQHRDDIVLRLARVLEEAQPWPRLSPRAS
jgi:aspartyl-tRNA(Asn)/glutamyl-tRNA(Gln) amidotransferase subunit A